MNKEILKEKEALVAEVETLAKASGSMLIVSYQKMTVAELGALRLTLRKINSKFAVYKNTMVRRATDKLGVTSDALNETLNGPNGFIFTEDALVGSKEVVKFAKKNDKLIVKGALQDGKFLTGEEVKVLASLPGREQLLAMLASALQGPIRQFAVAVKAVADKPAANA
jgi:large subunit ribosomal protein L10